MTIKSVLFAAALLSGSAAAADCGLDGWFLTGSNPDGYTCGSEAGPSGKIAFIKAKTGRPEGFATVMQQIAAGAYRGKRVRLTAEIKTMEADKVQLWMRVDGPNHGMLSFYNMDDRPVTGTSDWKPYAVVLDVPQQADGVAFGYFLGGKGEAWAKNFALTVVGTDVPVSVMVPAVSPKTPSNLSFDQ